MNSQSTGVILPGLAIAMLSLSAASAVSIDIRTHGATEIGVFENKGVREFTPPDLGEMLDAVLVLDDASKKYRAPGTLP